MFLAKKLNKGAGSPAPAADPQFNYVTMLLHGDGTNGAQNNTFLDSSVALTNLYFQTTQASSTAAFSSANLLGILPTSGSSKQLYDLDLGQSVTSFGASYTLSFAGVDILVSTNGTSWTTIYSGGSSSNTSITNSGNPFRYVRWWYSGGAWNFGLNNGNITRNGNTTQGSFSPYGSNWSNYFGASGDYLQAPSNSAFAVGSAFTIEAWVYLNATPSGEVAITCFGTTNGFQFGWQNGSTFGLAASGIAWRLTGTNTANANSWNHVVVSRSGTGTNQTSIYINGTRIANGTVSDAFSTTSSCYIARDFTGGGQFLGYISNLRIVKGTAVYDPSQSTLTVPTAPLTAISGTSLLTCQSNRFIDNSSNAFALTVGGSPSVQRFNPFGTSTAYSTSVIGGSGYFDGSGDYLSAPSNSALAMGTGDFTIEAYVYFSAVGIYDGVIIELRSSGGTSNGFVFNCRNTSGGYFLNFYTDGAANVSSIVMPYNTWNHVAVTRSGTTVRLFSNGVVAATFTKSNNFSDTPTPEIGQSSLYPNSNITGYMNGLRVVKGTALYTTTFTPPTAPLTAISGTSLLLSYINGAIYDNAMMNDLETVGNSQISTSVVKYGTGSIYFNGSGNYLNNYNGSSTTPPYQKFGLTFTIEMWVYRTSTTANQWFISTGQGYNNTTNQGFLIGYYTAYSGGSIAIAGYNLGAYWFGGTSAITANTWNHIAVVGNGTNCVLYLNGTNIGSQAWPSGYTGFIANGWIIGDGAESGSIRPPMNPFGGYIDDLRITNGYARYTTNFTPPTAAFPNTGPV